MNTSFECIYADKIPNIIPIRLLRSFEETEPESSEDEERQPSEKI